MNLVKEEIESNKVQKQNFLEAKNDGITIKEYDELYDKYDYYYDNDDNDYLLPEEIKLIIQLAPPVTEQDKDSIDQIQELELLKYRAGIKELTHKEFMERQIEILNRYNEKWTMYLFSEDNAYTDKCYKKLNEKLKER